MVSGGTLGLYDVELGCRMFGQEVSGHVYETKITRYVSLISLPAFICLYNFMRSPMFLFYNGFPYFVPMIVVVLVVT